MKKQLTATFLLLSIGIAGSGQYDYSKELVGELGISLNAMNCNTDVEGKIADPKNFKPSGGVYAGVLFRQSLGLRLEATLGTVTATDTRASKRTLKRRNLDFTSSISELSLLAEVHPLNILHNADNAPALSLYLLGGVSYFAFNPKTQLKHRWIYLQPLHTEGEGFPETGRPDYKLSQINFPVGSGLQYKLSERFVLRGEVIYRLLSTDYLDDVSTNYVHPSLFDQYLSTNDAALARKLADRSVELSGVPANKPGTKRGSLNKDAYYSVDIKLGMTLDGSRGSINARRTRKTIGCYMF